ncbi:MAG: PHP domain-containing protein [Nitrospirota bacterium]|nr:PHP domain-containing protein [Nitrospirota bacterium]
MILRNVADLHMHSNYSDGSCSPEELVRLAKKKNIGVIALTDHDLCDGVQRAMAEGKEQGIRVISGVEISVEYSGGTLHILGYGIPDDGFPLHKTLAEVREQRAARNKAMLDKLAEQGVPLTLEEVYAEAGDSQVGRPHFAAAMLKKGYVTTTQEAFEKYLGAGGAAFVKRFGIQPADAISLIHEAGGVSALAHPFTLNQAHRDNLEGYITELREMGLDGVECYNCEQTGIYRENLIAMAERLGLLVTGGSDFHGGLKPDTDMGCAILPEKHTRAFLDRVPKG